MARNMMISVLLLVSLIGVSFGVVTKCYICGSVPGIAETGCEADNVESYFQPITCPVLEGFTYNYCIKTYAHGTYGRSCSPVCVESVFLECCNTDGCNGGAISPNGGNEGGIPNNGAGLPTQGGNGGGIPTNGGNGGTGDMGGRNGTGGGDGNGNGSTATAVNLVELVAALFASAVLMKAQ